MVSIEISHTRLHMNRIKVKLENNGKCINIYYCMTVRAVQGNIQFEGGSIGLTALSDPKGMQ